MASPRHLPQSCNSPQRRLHSPLLVPAKFVQVTHHHKLLCKSPQEPPPDGGIASAFEQKCNGTGNNHWGPILGLSTLNKFLKTDSLNNGDTRYNKDFPASSEVGYLQRHILPYTDTQSVQEVHAFHIHGQSFQFKALPFGMSTAPMEFMVVVKEVKFLALQMGIRIHQYLDDWLVKPRSHQTCLQHTQTALCQELGWLVNKEI